jgi:hypothetical protein
MTAPKTVYDFSKGIRGKFYRQGLRLRLPIYLEEEAWVFVENLARKKKKDVSSVVNQWIITNKQFARMLD